MRLGIGTVQFGRDYGVTNAGGKVPAEQVRRILDRAASAGMDLLDTATLYGESETTLGAAMPAGHGFRIVTKTAQFQSPVITANDATDLLQTFRLSLKKLRRPAIYGLLLHRATDMLGPGGDRLFDALRQIKAEGLAKKIGASVYTGEEIDRLMDMGDLDLIQLPLNWLDQRLAASGHLAKLHAAGIEIHARSAFLQGVLLQAPDSLPAYFAPLRPHLAACRARMAAAGYSPVSAALAYPLSHPEVSAVVCGVTSVHELDQIIDAYPATPPAFEWAAYSNDDAAWLNPSTWAPDMRKWAISQ